MSSGRKWAVGLGTLVMIAGVFLFTVAQDVSGPRPSPEVVVPPSADSPGMCAGVAHQPPGQPVSVRAFIDGEELDDSPDETMEGEMNEFEFHIPPGNNGKLLKIEATAPDGTKTTRYVPIN